MSFADSRRNAGLVLSANHPGVSPTPLRAGGDVSWLPYCRPGDDQGQSGACTIFTFVNWAEIMTGRAITNADTLAVYAAALRRFNLPPGSGLQFAQAFALCHEAGWLPGVRALRPVTDLDRLSEQPIIAAGAVTDAWSRVSFQGCLNHDPSLTKIYAYHAYLIVAAGAVRGLSGRWITIENSWSIRWGWNGLGVMSADLHTRLCRELWMLC
jgi:hypothetical protein